MINNAHFRTFNENLARFIAGVKARALARALPRIGLQPSMTIICRFSGLSGMAATCKFPAAGPTRFRATSRLWWQTG
jgi:hypothetical protein